MIMRVGWRRDDGIDPDVALEREWLVTNGLGGYAAGTVAGVATRRYHGLLVAGLENPLGRVMMLNQIQEILVRPDGGKERLFASETQEGLDMSSLRHLSQFHLEDGLPVWTFADHDLVVEKRLFLGYMQNTVFVSYQVLKAPGRVGLQLRPAVDFRLHDASVGQRDDSTYRLTLQPGRFELQKGAELFPALRVRVLANDPPFVYQPTRVPDVLYRMEAGRGYEHKGELWSPGHFDLQLEPGERAVLVASTESWASVLALPPDVAESSERGRRRRLCALATTKGPDPVVEELALAADQFLIRPAGRLADATRARAEGEELRSVIAGYYWFTDWGRDTMISLEGLTLCTGRAAEGRSVLRTFARYVRDGLIPNLFPEGSQEGLYHTVDASLWFVHALGRYIEVTGDRVTLRGLLPVVDDILTAHRRGTRFGIRQDESDALLTQGSPQYPLTWMDAKCGDWIVTPRRGKPVEVNALWYSALRWAARWHGEEGHPDKAADLDSLATRARDSFNAKFWDGGRGYLRDLVEAEHPEEESLLRPNQILAVSLTHPVLLESRWAAVVDVVQRQLLTPDGLRSLAPGQPQYKPTYHGDLRTRDAAYHQGTAWSWLIGPFVDAWMRVHPGSKHEARGFLSGLVRHMGEAGLGSISEVFDAEMPYVPRGCPAQAWGVAELLRVWLATGGDV